MKDTKLDNKTIVVQMFGDFQVKSSTGLLNDDKIRSEMVTKLLTYFFCHKGRNITVAELGDVLWHDESSDNPAGALKNLMYRLRTILKKELGEESYLLTGHGSYCWNPEITLEMDTEKFEQLGEMAKRESDEAKKAKYYMEAITLYQGEFLPKLFGEFWIAPLSTYYHTAFLSMVKKLSEILEKKQRYDDLAEVSSQAIEQDALDEELHYYMIKALIGQNKQNLAIEHYRRATELLYEKLGIQPSKQLQDVYQELLKKKHEQELNLNIIQKELKENAEKSGAFFCEYGVFKEMYLLEVRRAARIGMSIYVSLITIIPPEYVPKESDAYLRIVKEAMDTMQTVLLHSLRLGDVISRYSGNQFILMLPMCNYEAAQMVMGRVEKQFYSSEKKMKAKMQFSLEEIQLHDE